MKKSCSTSTQKTGKFKIIQTFVSVKSSAWDTVSLSNRLYFTTSKNKQRYNTLSKNPSKRASQPFRLHVTVNYFKETDGPEKKNNYKLGGKKKEKK